MRKETYIASAIRHIAPSHRGDIVAVGLFERTVSLWDISTGNQISEFETILDFGGTRLALSQAEAACLTAAYRIHGLACYGTPAGELRWRRKDVKKIQQIAVTPDEKRAYCCLEGGPCQIIDISTGNTTGRIRGLKHVWRDPQDTFRLQESSKLAVVDRNGKQAFQIDRGSFAVLDAAFSKTYLAISESAADVRLFDLSSGREVVRHVQTEDYHVLTLSSSTDDSLFYGVQWNYGGGGRKRLLRFSPDSRETKVLRDLGHTAEAAFCHDGRYLLTSEGDLVECQSGETMRTLAFPRKEYPRPTSR